MELAAYDEKKVRITTVWGEVFEGEACFDSAEYCASEYGWAEDSLNLDSWIFRRSDIAAVELLAEEPRTWMSRRMHRMHLASRPFRLMEEGKKTLELRLNDPKRREIRVGDVIRFEDTSDETEVLFCEVTELLPFPSFRELYAALSPGEMGYGPGETANPADMDKYYTPEQQARWGVLAIRVKLL